MKKLSGTTIALLAVAVIALLFGVSKYNGFVSSEEGVNKAWADVQSAYQRRADLIPNLVSVVKGYAKHEQETFEKVTAARAKATSITIDAENMNPDEIAAKMKEFQQAQGELSSALKSLLAVQEAYPDLKANEQFSTLQAQLEGTENRINKARNDYNTTVQGYNKDVRSFPGNLVAGIFGFEKKTPFEAEAGAEKAPTVKFD
ncbi:LemA family protein [Pseudoprevotella muciniphila]|uniref:LemA family protein n=1 Tax=Pseudoprevotella muciniphila TaxID=2133944 RepID=A0A5P8E4B2_9BACT|nr:LemA family protein [Pseudoprevotella muciniphila]MBQ7663632.1 LemA family protein [Bacteroidaceae bacterium]QFQ11792.1 LemA family protein [Pseudoprevotella muciniphila]